MKVTLAELGFSKNLICETILCTYNPDGTPNAAPMGATMQNEQQITINIYNSAATLKNLKTRPYATLNLTGDADVFYRTALKDDALPPEWFEKAGFVNAPELKNADATIEAEVTQLTPIGKLKTQATLTIKHIKAKKTYPQTYNRALPAVLEAIIHATRIKTLIGAPEEREHVAKLYGLIQSCSEVVAHSAPNSRYSELMADLQRKTDSWRVKA